jgi:hypothetical protein
MDYDIALKKQFKDLKINLVRHDTSFYGLPCYIEVHLEKTPKDKGALVLDLGNYIYRCLGLRYQSTPEYRGRGKTTTIRWFMSWEDLEPIKESILNVFLLPRLGKLYKVDHYWPFEFHSLIIQGTSVEE